MAHGSFEDPETAALLSRRFISMQADREGRSVYTAVSLRSTWRRRLWSCGSREGIIRRETAEPPSMSAGAPLSAAGERAACPIIFQQMPDGFYPPGIFCFPRHIHGPR